MVRRAVVAWRSIEVGAPLCGLLCKSSVIGARHLPAQTVFLPPFASKLLLSSPHCAGLPLCLPAPHLACPPPICSSHAPHTVQVFLSAHLPDARASLRPGASEADIQALEAALGISMPSALRAMYR